MLILFDPRSRGRLAAELFQGAADEFGWILASSNNTMSDGPGEPNARAINAMIPDVMKRLPIDEKRIYAGGFSGGAVLAWTVGLKGNYLAGAISIGGRPAPEHLALAPKFALFAAAGEGDFNYQPTRELDRLAAKAGVPHRLEFFPGPHAWCPPAMARQAVGWLEVLAMRDGRTPRDAARIEALLTEEMAAAEVLAGTGDALTAGRRFTQIGETFEGMGAAPTLARAKLRAQGLLASGEAKSSVKEEKAAEKFESLAFRRIGEASSKLRTSESPVAVGEIRHLLGVDEVLRRRDAGGIGGSAAVRVLAAIQVQLGFYLTQELFAAGDYRRAVPGLALGDRDLPRRRLPSLQPCLRPGALGSARGSARQPRPGARPRVGAALTDGDRRRSGVAPRTAGVRRPADPSPGSRICSGDRAGAALACAEAIDCGVLRLSRWPPPPLGDIQRGGTRGHRGPQAPPLCVPGNHAP